MARPMKPRTKVHILLDASSSMWSQKNQTVDAINTYVKGLKDSKVNGDITLTTFAGVTPGAVVFGLVNQHDYMRTERLRSNVKISAWENLGQSEYAPNGSTPLYDAVGYIMSDLIAEKPERAVIVIVTDGAENSSQKFNNTSAKALLDAGRAFGWQVVFLGVEWNAMVQAEALGIRRDSVLNNSRAGLARGMAATAAATASYAATGQSMVYSAEDRKAAGFDV